MFITEDAWFYHIILPINHFSYQDPTITFRV